VIEHESDLRILHVIDSGGLYGAEAVVMTLMEESTRQGHFAVLGSLSDPDLERKPIEAEAARRGLPFKRFEMGTIPGPFSAGRILHMIRNEKIDLVHTHGYKANVLFGLLPRALRCFPVVCTLHGWCSTRPFTKLRFFEWLDSRTLSRHDGVVVVSGSMLDLPALTGRELPLLRVIHNAAAAPDPAPLGGPAADEIEAFCRLGFTFGSIGRLSVEKNFMMVLQAMVQLRAQGLDAQLLIMGEGRQRPLLSEYIEQHGLTEKVLMPGYVARAERYLPQLGAYVLSSATEGMPISILEAMASGIPIISTTVGEVPEMLGQGDAGLLVEPGDVPGLVQAMERVFNDAGLRRRVGDEARRISAERYSAVAMTRAYAELYRLAMKAKAAGPKRAN